MRPYLVTAALCGLLLVIGVYLYAIEFPRAAEQAEAERQAKRLVTFTGGDVVGLTFQYRDGYATTLVHHKEDGHWWITDPVRYPADHVEVNDVIRDLTVAEIARTVSETGENLREFGLSPPQLTLSVVLKQGNEQFLIGEKGPVSSQLYFKRAAEPAIYLTTLPDRDILAKTLFRLRRKEIVEIDRANVERIEIRQGNHRVSLSRNEKGWGLTHPIQARGDESVIGSFLYTIETLKTLEFIEERDERAALRETFEAPSLTLKLDHGGSSQTIALYLDRNDGNAGYVVTTPDAPIFRIASTVIQGIPTSVFSLRDKHLVSVDPVEVTGIQVNTPRQELFVPMNAPGVAPSEQIARFFKKVVEFKAEHVVEPVARPDRFGRVNLDPPALEVVLTGEGGHVLGHLLVSDILSGVGPDQTGAANAWGSSLPGVYRVRSDILVDIPSEVDLRTPHL